MLIQHLYDLPPETKKVAPGRVAMVFPERWGGRQGTRIVYGNSREEVIRKLCAHPDSWLAKMGRPIEEFSDQELVDVIKKENEKTA